MGLRDTILSVDDKKMITVEVPEWSTTVHIKVMSGADRDDFEGEILKSGKVNHDNLRAKLLVKCICEPDGKRVFEDQDYVALGQKSAAVLDRLFDAAQNLNAIGQKDIDSLKNV